MKKTRMLIATLAIGMLASCSKDSGSVIDEGSGNGTTPPDNAPVELSLGVKQTALNTEVKTRGIGGIGGVSTDENKWNGETLYIYAISNEPLDVVPTNEKATAPAGDASGAITWATADQHFYYGGTSVYTFYGYHIDDATINGADPDPQGNITDGFSIPFVIDGTQDLMVAATDKTADIAASSKSGELTGKEANLYSAWSARRDVTPNLVFKHLLSRLKFTVKAGDDETAAANVSIKKIAVYSRSEGTLVVVPSADGTTTIQGLKDITDLPDDLTGVTPFELMEKPADGTKDLIPLNAVVADSKDNPKIVGESMLVIPADSYKMIVTTSQTIGVNEQEGTIIKTLEKPSKSGIEAPSFEAGKMYTIAISVYGLKEIEVKATLTAWEDGGNIEVDPDNEPAPTPNPAPQP